MSETNIEQLGAYLIYSSSLYVKYMKKPSIEYNRSYALLSEKTDLH